MDISIPTFLKILKTKNKEINLLAQKCGYGLIVIVWLEIISRPLPFQRIWNEWRERRFNWKKSNSGGEENLHLKAPMCYM